MTTPIAQAEEAVLSAEAARLLFDEGLDDAPISLHEPSSPAGADAAVEALAACFDSLPGTVRSALAGAEDKADQLSGDRLQGLAEIVQNADDCGARRVVLRLEGRDDGCSVLFVAHDGDPVRLRDVLALATPWLTTKADDADAMGRFGIGLMTLRSLAPRVDVRSGHYRIRLGGYGLSVTPARAVPEDMDDATWTVFALDLAPGTLGRAELAAWLGAWDESALLFLTHVREVRLADDGSWEKVSLRLETRDLGAVTSALTGGDRQIAVREQACADGRRWMTYTTRVPAPPGRARAHKASGKSVPLGIAVPLRHDETGALHAGLPVRPVGLPFRLAAQFDPLASRQELASTPWNEEALRLLAELWIDVAVDLFRRDPAAAWRAVALAGDAGTAPRLQPPLADALESHLLRDARAALLGRVVVAVGEERLPLADLAFEAPALEGLVTAEETARLAGRHASLPTSARDAGGRWRKVLGELAALGGPAPVLVTVEDALPLLENDERPVAATAALWAAALRDKLQDRLRGIAGVPTADGRRVRMPAPTDPWLLCSGAADEVAGALRLAVPVDDAFLDGPDGSSVGRWLRTEGALADEPDAETVLSRLAATGEAGRWLAVPLTDRQAEALRDAFERLPPADRAALGKGVGKAVLLQGRTFEAGGKAVPVDVRPAEAYLVEKEQDSWWVAAGRTEGLRWVHPRYSDTLRSPAGRDGLGAQRFLRLLGAETAPRPRPHPKAINRYSGRPAGVNRNVSGAPGARRTRLVELGATYTVLDHDCPDLAAVLRNISQEPARPKQLKRAGALLASLGRSWERLRDTASCTAAGENYNWEPKAAVASWWVADAAETAWLSDGTGTPRRPDSLRLRTSGTVAVYGDDPAVFVHPDLDAPARRAPLEALGVTGDAPASELVQTLAGLRERPADADGAARAAVVYRALSAQYARSGQGRNGPDVPVDRLRTAFAAGGGLVLTSRGWRTPGQVHAGDPVFGTWRDFVPPVPGADRLWQLLRVRSPDADDCVQVLREIARRRKPLSAEDAVVCLDTFRLLQRLAGDAPMPGLGRLSLWTSQGWTSRRPVYAVSDLQLAAALGTAVAVWHPGGPTDQFRGLLPRLGVTAIGAGDGRAVLDDRADDDDELTETFAAAVRLLQVDLALNDPTAEASAVVPWETLAEVVVRVAPGLRIAVGGTHLQPAPVLPTAAHLDMGDGVLWLRDPFAAGQVDGGGGALAAAFGTDRRRLAQAWLAAWAAAEQGRRVELVKLAARRATEEAAEQERAQADALAALQQEAGQRRAADRGKRSATGDGAAPAKPRVPKPPPAQPARVLVDPSTLELADANGTVAPAQPRSPKPPPGKRGGAPTAPDPAGRPPKPGGRAPAQYSPVDKESLGLDLLRRVLSLEDEGILDLRAQHGVGADAVQDLRRFFELKVHGGAAPDTVRLTDSEVGRAAAAGHDFFLVVVSDLEGADAEPKVRIITDPLKQLDVGATGFISMSGVQRAAALEFSFRRAAPSDDGDPG